MTDIERCDEIERLLLIFFKGDHEKYVYWLVTENLNFGTSPAALLRAGRADKVLRFIRDAGHEGGWLPVLDESVEGKEAK